MESLIVEDLNTMQFSYIAGKVDWFCPKQYILKTALENSHFKYTVFYDSQLVGMARVISDRATFFCIRDLAIIPEYQRNGIGSKLLEKIIDDIKHAIFKSPCMVEIQCSLGTEGFYKKAGFKIRPNCGNGAGMYLLIKPQEL